MYSNVQSWHLTYDIGDDEVDVDGDDQEGEEGGKNPRNHTVCEIPHNPAQKTTSGWLYDCPDKKSQRGKWEVLSIQSSDSKNLITCKFERGALRKQNKNKAKSLTLLSL